MLLLHGVTISLAFDSTFASSEAIEADRLGDLDTLVARLSKTAPR